MAPRPGGGRGQPQRGGEDLGPRSARPALDGRANGPVIRDTVSIFGSDRCLFASNYPVDSLVASFDTIVEVMRAALSDHSAEDRAQIFSGNAVRLYRLELGS